MSGLFPGYTQVEKFGPDEDYEAHDGEVEEEVEYVTLDLGTVQPTLVPSSSTYRLVVSPFLKLRVLVRLTCIGHVFQGLDTHTPFLQLSGTMLKGQHVSLLGTELLFTESTGEYATAGNCGRGVHLAEASCCR